MFGVRLVLLLCTLALMGCGPAARNTPPPETAETDDDFGPGDQFEVRVYGEEDLSDTYTVTRDGSIDFPYLNRVEVAGLEPAEVAQLLEEGLREREVLVDPQVVVEATEYASKRVIVRGAVRNPSSYPMRPGLTVLEAVGLAGGTTDLANRDGAILTRRVEGEARLYHVPLDEITFGRQDDVRIQDGDILFVPERTL